ncbi:MAG: hypothetical protein GWP19_13325, partial [Planctomycetia bacterium]|nr:hypothetical protein [Planctomycetia bacterium]
RFWERKMGFGANGMSIAIRYQIMIMYMWISTATMVDILVLNLVYRQFFTPQMQLKLELLRKG